MVIPLGQSSPRTSYIDCLRDRTMESGPSNWSVEKRPSSMIRLHGPWCKVHGPYCIVFQKYNMLIYYKLLEAVGGWHLKVFTWVFHLHHALQNPIWWKRCKVDKPISITHNQFHISVLQVLEWIFACLEIDITMYNKINSQFVSKFSGYHKFPKTRFLSQPIFITY